MNTLSRRKREELVALIFDLEKIRLKFNMLANSQVGQAVFLQLLVHCITHKMLTMKMLYAKSYGSDSTVRYMVNALEDHKWIKRRHHSRDLRVTEVVPMPKLQKRVSEMVDKFEHRINLYSKRLLDVHGDKHYNRVA